MKENIARFLIAFVLLLPLLSFFNTGFLTDSPIKVLQTIVFAASFSLVMVWGFLRKYILIWSLFLLASMVVLYTFTSETTNLMAWADLAGSSAMGLVTLTLLSYLPQLIKKGYIEKV